MCQVKCPVGINTGELIKSIRADQLDAPGKSVGYGISKVNPPPPLLRFVVVARLQVSIRGD
jgi:Fe-S oxidoreductase